MELHIEDLYLIEFFFDFNIFYSLQRNNTEFESE